MLVLFAEVFHEPLFDGVTARAFGFFLFDQFVGTEERRRADLGAEEADALVPGDEFEDVVEGTGIDAVDIGFDQFPCSLTVAAPTALARERMRRIS